MNRGPLAREVRQSLELIVMTGVTMSVVLGLGLLAVRFLG
jgi:hypothetical protein